MKSSRSRITIVSSALFVAGLLCLYYGVTNQVFVWVMFFPLKAAQLIAQNIIHLQGERFIMFSLAVGTPLTVLYWQLWLRGLYPRVRR